MLAQHRRDVGEAIKEQSVSMTIYARGLEVKSCGIVIMQTRGNKAALPSERDTTNAKKRKKTALESLVDADDADGSVTK
jgi:hypothetical protein